MNVTATKELRFSCVSTKQFTIALQNQHVWKCVYCNTIFGRRGGLRRHVQMVHMQMMHKCPIENCTHPGYKCTKALNAHVRTHTRPFQCDRCDASYTRKADLQNHLTLHN
uniref:C2H2-type domain-containing protein n=1 Tax=Caenorhabditis tropicalis TaxID=1561998 RepID=A0A1I7TF84_9PELO